MGQIPDFFSIDLGDHQIKFAELRNISKDSAKLANYHSAPTSIGVLYNDSAKGVELLAQEIKENFDKSGIKTRNCVMSVPEVSIFSRLITLPKVEKEEDVGESIMWAIKPLIPVSIEEVNISYIEIDTVVKDRTTYVNWYVVAAPKRLIEKFQTVTLKMGLNLLAIETEALATSRIIQFNHNFNSENVMIVDLGGESTNIILARNNAVLFSQTMSSGSNAITKVIAADYGIDEVMAEKYKISYGLDKTLGDGKIANSIEPAIQLLTSEIGRTLAYFREKITGSPVKMIFLTGGGAGLPKLDEYIASKFNLQTIKANPFAKIKIDNSLKGRITDSNKNSLNVVLGLGLKGLL